MGKRPSEIKVFVRDLLLRIAQERNLPRTQMAADLGISPNTLKGLLRPDPRPASQDVQERIRRAYDVDPRGPKPPPVVGTYSDGCVRFTTRPDMPAEVAVRTAIAELGAREGDWLRLEPHTGPLLPGRWYVVSFGRREDVLVKAELVNGALHFREADAPIDDVRPWLSQSHRAHFQLTAIVRAV